MLNFESAAGLLAGLQARALELIAVELYRSVTLTLGQAASSHRQTPAGFRLEVCGDFLRNRGCKYG